MKLRIHVHINGRLVEDKVGTIDDVIRGVSWPIKPFVFIVDGYCPDCDDLLCTSGDLEPNTYSKQHVTKQLKADLALEEPHKCPPERRSFVQWLLETLGL